MYFNTFLLSLSSYEVRLLTRSQDTLAVKIVLIIMGSFAKDQFFTESELRLKGWFH